MNPPAAPDLGARRIDVTPIETERLSLRAWRDEDRAPFAALNADPRVMEHFPAPLSRAESDAFVDRHGPLLDERGWGLWAVEVRATDRAPGAPFIGYVGLAVPGFEADFMPCVEIGWRIAAEHWGRGYAPEAARAVLDVAFGPLGLDEVVSFTFVGNDRSRRVMEKIGLTEAFEFDHPSLPGSPIQRHVLYRRTNPGRPAM